MASGRIDGRGYGYLRADPRRFGRAYGDQELVTNDDPESLDLAA